MVPIAVELYAATVLLHIIPDKMTAQSYNDLSSPDTIDL